MTTAPHNIGDGPVQDEYLETMKAIVKLLDESFNGDARGKDRKTGFVLLVFPFNSHDGRCNYMSNGADRKDIVTMFREQIARFEGSPDQTGRA
jgi:hypothetical protein